MENSKPNFFIETLYVGEANWQAAKPAPTIEKFRGGTPEFGDG